MAIKITNTRRDNKSPSNLNWMEKLTPKVQLKAEASQGAHSLKVTEMLSCRGQTGLLVDWFKLAIESIPQTISCLPA